MSSRKKRISSISLLDPYKISFPDFYHNFFLNGELLLHPKLKTR